MNAPHTSTRPLSIALPRVAITLSACAKTFHGQQVLAPLDLDIAAGETLVLLGPSGCGKTTTLRMIAGLERPDQGGRVLFDGEDVTALPIEKRQVGMVFQSYALFPNMTVRDNVGYGLRVQQSRGAKDLDGQALTRDGIRARVDRLLSMMELSAHAEKRIDALSGGQRQRVALARALAPQPRVLLLDEPLTALDARLRDILRTEMNQLLRTLGVTTVYVTHDQAEAMALGDRIVVMSAGRVEQAGTPRDIYYRPASRHVAEFIGTMNRITGVVRDGFLHLGDTRVPIVNHDRVGASASSMLTPREAFFRPEDASLCFADDAHLHGTVRSITFLGDRSRLIVGALRDRIDAPESYDSQSTSDTPPDTVVTLDVPGRTALTQGDRVSLRLRENALMLLDKEPH
jgi:putative spermidine/putrescine transport system ATP-binding protein